MSDDSQELLTRFEPKEFAVLTADPQVLVARFHPSGKLLAAGGYDGRVRWWDLAAEAPQELPALTGHNGWVQAVAFSRDGQRLYTADSWGKLCAWDVNDNAPRLVWSLDEAHAGWLRDLDVSADGLRLVTCGRDRIVRIWAAVDGAPLFELRGHNTDVYSVRFHPQQPLVVSGDDRGIVKLWGATDGRMIRQFDAGVLYLEHRLQDVGGVRTLAFDRAGSTLAVGGTIPKGGGTVQGTPSILLFDFANGGLTHTLKFGDENHCFVHDVILHDAGFVMAVTSGTPGQGQVLFQRPGDEKPFFTTTKLSNCHSIHLHEPTGRLAVVATNRGSNGNGRQLGKDGEYQGNNSPIHLFQFAEAAATA
jgi:WD40 repeat protein